MVSCMLARAPVEGGSYLMLDKGEGHLLFRSYNKVPPSGLIVICSITLFCVSVHFVTDLSRIWLFSLMYWRRKFPYRKPEMFSTFGVSCGEVWMFFATLLQIRFAYYFYSAFRGFDRTVIAMVRPKC